VSNLRAPLLVVLAAATMGCGAGSAPAVDEAPSAGGVSVAPAGKLNTVVSGGAKDSVESIPGSESSPYVYRFRMTDPSGSGFSYQDRDLSFYFRPGPDALYFQVENRQNRVVWIDWERSVFYEPDAMPVADGVEPREFAVRLTQAIAQIMQTRTADGYVFRVDLRLRPDPCSWCSSSSSAVIASSWSR